MAQTGLTTAEASRLLQRYGSNELPSQRGATLLQLILPQFSSAVTLLLALAALLSFFIGDKTDAWLIFFILTVNGLLSVWQEYKASKEVEALRKLEVLTSRVVRDRQEQRVLAKELVPGDVVVVESGDKIPSDGVLIESFDLSVDESAITGESLSVVKNIQAPDNVLYFGSSVVSGRAKFKVTGTGKGTYFGRLAENLATITEEPTPLERTINDFSKRVGALAVGLALLLFVIRALQGSGLLEALFISLALMVAAVPEGFPAIVTLLLAFGVRRMYQHKTIVRRMSAIESLGATNVICTDKTGTLTENKMRVKAVSEAANEKELLRCALLCNSASLVLLEKGDLGVLGDGTEGALLLWARDRGFDAEAVRSRGKIVEEIAFSMQRKMMSVLWQENGQKTVFAKGAPEVLLPLCKLEAGKSQQLEEAYKRLAVRGLRVLALAKKETTVPKILEDRLQFLGFVGIADALRPESKFAVVKARQAGIEVVMVTGDNPLTARSVAEEIGLLQSGDEILTGAQLDRLSDIELKTILPKIKIFSRVVPEHKLRIVRAFQSLGKVVAVTGDGVNDALALKAAQVGVAMGEVGTDVAKEAADIIILDDNLETIVAAVEQGRLTYSNIVKAVKYLMAGNLSEVFLVLGAALLALPTPLLPVQILWINLVTDGLPALSLAADKASGRIMSEKPRDVGQSILDPGNISHIAFFGLGMGTVSLAGFLAVSALAGLPAARAAAFSLVVILQMIYIFVLRRHHSPFSNKYLLGSVALVLMMQLLIVSVEPLRVIFKL